MGIERNLRWRIRRWGVALLLMVWLLPPSLDGQAKKDRQEESEDYFRRWLNEDVLYIISDAERDVFEKLTTVMEKENFIEQFWRRRDPDTRTFENEFKEEHYRRIAYANEHFASGISGWKTDRGRIYIIHGPPDSIEDYPSGRAYERPDWEGGGGTTTFPYQSWYYRFVEGVGPDVELEFVDKTLSGAYRLAYDPFEKDAFANVPSIGLTRAEEQGLTSKHGRFTQTTGSDYYPLMVQRYKDKPFVRFETLVGVQRPPKLRYEELKEVVDVGIAYAELPFALRQDQFRLDEQHALFPITLEFDHKELSFPLEKGAYRARIAIYGVVTDLNREIVKEFEDDVEKSFPPDQLERGRKGRSLYQKILALEQGRRYKLTLVAKDLESGKVGVLERAIVAPRYGDGQFSASSLILSDSIRQIEGASALKDEMFLLGDTKIHPKLDGKFRPDRQLGVYLQVYNAAVDQASQQPALSVQYELLRGDDLVFRIVEDANESMLMFSPWRIVLTRSFSPGALAPGPYRMRIKVSDKIGSQWVQVSGRFEIVPLDSD